MSNPEFIPAALWGILAVVVIAGLFFFYALVAADKYKPFICSRCGLSTYSADVYRGHLCLREGTTNKTIFGTNISITYSYPQHSGVDYMPGQIKIVDVKHNGILVPKHTYEPLLIKIEIVNYLNGKAYLND